MSQALNLETIRGLVAECLGVSLSMITDDAHFINDLNADSLECVELAMEIEDYFGIEIIDEDAEKLRTLSAWMEYLGKHHQLAAA